MKISNNNVSTTHETETSRTKTIVLWVLFVCLMVFIGAGSAALLINKDASQADTSDPIVEDVNPAEEVVDAGGTAQAEIEAAVEHALSEQAVKHQETVAELEGQLKQFEQDDVEGYQAQVSDLQEEIKALREANEELREANQTLSDANAELTERTTVAEVQEAYEAQIKQLESDNQKLEDLLQGIQRQLEDGQ